VQKKYRIVPNCALFKKQKQKQISTFFLVSDIRNTVGNLCCWFGIVFAFFEPFFKKIPMLAAPGHASGSARPEQAFRCPVLQ